MQTKPLAMSCLAFSNAPMSLSKALWRPTSSRTSTISPCKLAHAAAWVAPVRSFSGCLERNMACALNMACVATITSGACGKAKRTWPKLSAPHSPQPVRPAMLRRRSFRACSACAATSSRTSMPCANTSVSTPKSCDGVCNKPSVRAKPKAKSSRSVGLAIITAWVMPLNTSATGTSSAKAKAALWRVFICPSLQRLRFCAALWPANRVGLC